MLEGNCNCDDHCRKSTAIGYVFTFSYIEDKQVILLHVISVSSLMIALEESFQVQLGLLE